MPGAHYVKFLAIFISLITMPGFFSEFSLAAGEDRGSIFSMGFSGSYFDPGWQLKLNTTGGYQFNRHFEITAGLPVYFVRLPDETGEDGMTSKTGIGNLYFDVALMAPYPNWYFSSSVRVAAPTGDEDEGFSTGKATYEWNNYFEVSLGNWTPFGSAGIANSISDTHFLTRPFSTLGFVGQFEGGVLFDPVRWLGFGASGYAVAPSGEQEIFSRKFRQGGPTSGESGSGTRRGWMYGDSAYTVAEAEDLRDHGFSTWMDVYPSPDVALSFGYSRSVSYEYNTLFFSTRFNLAGMIRKARN